MWFTATFCVLIIIGRINTTYECIKYTGDDSIFTNFYSKNTTRFTNKLFDDSLVELNQGKIRGHILKSENGKEFYAFQEIPYAAPPIGNNRFKEPTEPEPWHGILNTTKNSKMCMQQGVIPENLEINEDCLYINVYTPLILKQHNWKNALLPILFWIHGGQFIYESGAIEYYNPKYLMDYDIIVVTINYRLGPFGYLATTDGIIPGNLALKDQLFAIQWLYKNIHLFGGDKSRITIMGSSAGAMNIGYLQLSPLVKGLVKSYILQSGSPLCPYAYQPKPDYYAFQMGRALDKNFNSQNSSKLLELLRQVSAQQILDAIVLNNDTDHPLTKNIIWIPVIEDPDYENAIVTAPMLQSIMNGDFDKKPMLMGVTSEEALTLLPGREELALEARRYDNNPKMMINFKLNVSENQLQEAGLAYKRVYTLLPFSKHIEAFIKFLGQEIFDTPSMHYAFLASLHTRVYYYQFSHKGQIGQGNMNYSGVGHAEDIHYLFGGLSGVKNDLKSYPEYDQLTMKRMLILWTNFVKYQNPTPTHENGLGIHWPYIKNGKIKYLNINITLEIKEDPKQYRRVKGVFDKYRRPPYFIY